MKRAGWLVDTAALILLATVCAASNLLGRLHLGPWAVCSVCGDQGGYGGCSGCGEVWNG